MGHLEQLADDVDQQLADADRVLSARHLGRATARQPVHTVYLSADRFDARAVAGWGHEALQLLDQHAASAAAFAAAIDLAPELAEVVYPRVRDTLATAPIEDLRVDFEDGYGTPSDEQEDADALMVAKGLTDMRATASAPRLAGIRVKSFEARTRRRAIRTVDLVVGELVGTGAATDGLVLTLPKVTSVDQVAALAFVCEASEQHHGLRPGSLSFEIQVETPQCIVGGDGRALVAPMVHASAGRCVGLHFGTYDYSAACGIAPAYQSMEHPVADHAKAVMQVAAASTGVVVSDGSTNVLPVGDRSDVHAGWRLHARLVRRSLERGYYQGWDLHPAQLPTRFAATYAFYREGLIPAVGRLAAYTSGRHGSRLDEPATATALADFVQRGLDCGAVDETELLPAGLDPAVLRSMTRDRTATVVGEP